MKTYELRLLVDFMVDAAAQSYHSSGHALMCPVRLRLSVLAPYVVYIAWTSLMRPVLQIRSRE